MRRRKEGRGMAKKEEGRGIFLLPSRSDLYTIQTMRIL